jgi:WD40 repeat protein
LTIEETAGSLVGSLEGTGDGLCSLGGVFYSGAGPTSILRGSVTGTRYDITANIAHFAMTGTRRGDSLVGTLAWTINLVGGVPVNLVGSWRAARLPDNPPATTTEFLTIGPDLPRIPEGDSVHLTVAAKNSQGAVLAHPPALTYTVSDTNRATVSPTGWLKASFGAGPFSVGVHGGQGYAEVVGQSITRVHTLRIQPAGLVMNRTHAAQLTVTALDHDGYAIPISTLTFSSSNPAIATVSATGRVAGPGPVGQAWIRVSGGPLSDSIPVSIVAIPVSFTLTPREDVISPGDSLRLQEEILDSAGLVIDDSSLVHLTSSNPSVATVSPGGLVHTVGPLGYTDITGSLGPLVSSTRILARSAPAPAIVATTTIGGSPAGVAVAADGTMYVGDALDGTLYGGTLPGHALTARLATGGQVTSIAFTPDGTRAFVVHDSLNAVLVLNTATSQIVDSIPVATQTLSVSVTPDGQRLIIGTNSSVLIYGATSLDSLGAIATGAALFLAFHPTQPLLYASAGAIYEINYSTGSLLRQFTTGGGSGIAVAPDGSELYMASAEGALQIWDLGSGTLKETNPIEGYSVAYSAAQDLLYLTLPGGGIVTVLDRKSRVVVAIINSGLPRLVALDAAGTTAVVTNENGWVDFIR